MPIAVDAAPPRLRSRRKPTWRVSEGGSKRFLPVHSTPVSIITARDDDGDCTEIQSDLPTGRPSDDAGAPSLPSRLVGVRAYTLSLCRQSGADSKGQVKTNSPRLRLLSRLSWFVSGLVRLRPSDCATLPFLRC